VKVYIKEKIKLLKDFGVNLSANELERLKGMRTEIAVDNFARAYIERKLG
jgi:hypothetical protein